MFGGQNDRLSGLWVVVSPAENSPGFVAGPEDTIVVDIDGRLLIRRSVNQRDQAVAGVCVPQLERVVIRSRDDPLAVGREPARPDPSRRRTVRGEKLRTARCGESDCEW